MSECNKKNDESLNQKREVNFFWGGAGHQQLKQISNKKDIVVHVYPCKEPTVEFCISVIAEFGQVVSQLVANTQLEKKQTSVTSCYKKHQTQPNQMNYVFEPLHYKVITDFAVKRLKHDQCLSNEMVILKI